MTDPYPDNVSPKIVVTDLLKTVEASRNLASDTKWKDLDSQAKTRIDRWVVGSSRLRPEVHSLLVKQLKASLGAEAAKQSNNREQTYILTRALYWISPEEPEVIDPELIDPE